MLTPVRAIFRKACPNCGNDITDDRLWFMLPCDRCLPEDEARKLISNYYSANLSPLEFKLSVLEKLKELGHLKDYYKVVELDILLKELDRLFEKAIGSRLWSAQRTWAKRVLKGKSFAIIAPTGVGKTMFGIVISLYLASRGKRCYMLLPTSLLVRQVYERMQDIAKRLSMKVNIFAYLPGLSKNARKEFNEKIRSGEFDVLITTSQFLSRNFDQLLKGLRFDFIFVDDVDALLRSSRNIDRVLMLLGFNEEHIRAGLELIRLKRRVPILIALARKNEEYSEELDKVMSRIAELRDNISKIIEKVRPGILIVSSATGRPRGLRVRLFRELLDFEAGSRSELIRNIEDIYVGDIRDLFEETLRVVRIFGSGGLVFVPLDKGLGFAEKLKEYLVERGIKADVVAATRKKDQIDKFISGELDILIGVATYYGLLVRGLDIPHRIRYAVFTGVPKFRFFLDITEAHPFRVVSLLTDLRDYVEGKEKEEVDRIVGLMMRYLRELPPTSIQEISNAISSRTKLSGRLGKIQELFEYGFKKVQELLEREDIRKKLKESPYISVEEVNGRLRISVPDVMTYIQASGRTSRMFAGGISKGASIVLVDDPKVFEGLVRKTRWFIEDIEWKPLEEVDVERLLAEIDRDRKLIKEIMEGRVPKEYYDPVKSALLIVESPSKARTIARFFGRPSIRRIGRYAIYEVSTGGYILSIMASGGHIFDLTMDPKLMKESIYGVLVRDKRFIPVYDTIRRCNVCGEQFVGLEECPRCKSEDYFDKREILELIRDIAREVDLLLIGTDPDTEGEKIGWDIATVIRPYTNTIRRIEFHEVTKRAIENSLRSLRDIDERLVESQIVRRIEDRWIGFALSEKVQRKYGRRTLSAGRVQTPVLGWIIERYEEYKKNIRDFFYIDLENGLQLILDDYPIKEGIKKTVEELKNATFKVESIKVYEDVINPPPPFTTDQLLYEASNRLGMSASEAMTIAQSLFEIGLITYHRTDSTRVSAVGRAIAHEYIKERYGEDYFQGREWGKGGAHECIRPTRPLNSDKLSQLIREGILRLTTPLTYRHYRLYELIFRRFMASQMKPAKVMRAKVILRFGDYVKEIEGVLDILYDGFTVEYPLQEVRLPKMREGEELKVINVTHIKRSTKTLYSQGEIIELMRKRRIGRPSTYAKIVSTLLERGYVSESRKRKKLIPTKLGMEVYKYLSTNYMDLVSEDTTRRLEELMENIEKGVEDYQKVIERLYMDMQKIMYVQEEQ